MRLWHNKSPEPRSVGAFSSAFAGRKTTSHDMQDAERGGLVDCAEGGLGLVSPGDLSGHGYWSGARGSSGVQPLLYPQG